MNAHQDERVNMHYMLCKQKIEDFDEFQQTLASHGPAHQASGFRVQHIWRNIYDPKQVFFICEVGDIARAKAFVESETERLKESGISEFPDIYYLREG